MGASVSLREMPLTVTVLAVPTFLLAKVALVGLALSTSPATRLSVSVAVALVPPSYTLLTPVALTSNARAVMSAVVMAVVEAS